MRSTAHIKSHPIHPILVPFPIAFLIGSFLFDLYGFVFKEPALYQTSFYMQVAGIGFAVLAAIPGLIDLNKTVPPDSSARKRGIRHGILNTLMLIIFTIAWFYRKGDNADMRILLLMEFTGSILLFIAGWMGGTLVYRNQIGVDRRYAHSGKWKEVFIPDDAPETFAVEGAEDLKYNQMILVHKGDKRMVLALTENGFVAFDDRCPHKGASLAAGAIMCGTVQCPWHGSQFHVHSGEVTAGPAEEGIRIYKVLKDSGKIFISTINK